MFLEQLCLPQIFSFVSVIASSIEMKKYADLDYFKWFNDRYGFQKGDQMIQFTADVLQQSISACGHPYDFVGHIGGDDFIIISESVDAGLLCST
jgi:diguanylate cyclase (GGDEF)-like protein